MQELQEPQEGRVSDVTDTLVAEAPACRSCRSRRSLRCRLPPRANDPTALPSRPPRRGALRPRDAEAERACRSRGRRGANPYPSQTLTALPWTLTPTEAGFVSGALRQCSAEMIRAESSPHRSDDSVAALQRERAEHKHVAASIGTFEFKTASSPPFQCRCRRAGACLVKHSRGTKVICRRAEMLHLEGTAAIGKTGRRSLRTPAHPSAIASAVMKIFTTRSGNGRPEQGCAPLCKEVRPARRLFPLHSKFESSCAGVRRSLQRRAACSPLCAACAA